MSSLAEQEIRLAALDEAMSIANKWARDVRNGSTARITASKIAGEIAQLKAKHQRHFGIEARS